MKRILCLLLMVPFMALASSLQDGLVAWYKFDGNLNDASGNGYDMAGTCGGYVQGQGTGGQALSCAEGTAVGPSKKIEVEASFTISCWLKADEDIAVVSESSSGIKTNGKMVLTPGQCYTYGSMSGAGVGFAYGKNGVAIYEHGGSYLPAVLMHSANVGTGWNHLVITVSNDNAPMLYLNGEFARQGVKGARTHRCVMLGKDSATIGGEFYGNRFNGCIDDFRIYNRALSADEVKALCGAGGDVPTAGNVSVKSVTAQQRYPWNGLVDITVTIQGSAADVARAECTFSAINAAKGSVISVAHVTRDGDDSGSGSVWTRKFVWDAVADVGTVKIDDVELTGGAEIRLGGVQLWRDGPYWAEYNVGATKSEECGYYFWWGDTIGYKRAGDSWIAVDGSRTGFSFSPENCPTYIKENTQLRLANYIDSTGNLVAEHDAATVHFGAPWRMPTVAEFNELISKCDNVPMTRNGVTGRLVKGRGAYSSMSIFLPLAGMGLADSINNFNACGYYWSSSPRSDYADNACELFFYSSYFYQDDSCRFYGYSVRPIRDVSSEAVLAFPGKTTHFVLDCRKGVRTASTQGEDLRYNANWYANGSKAYITDNGENVVSGSSGTKRWTPAKCGDHHLQLIVANGNGTRVGSATADFLYDNNHTGVESVPAVAATCLANGRTAEVKCSHCGKTLESSRVVPALGHDRKTTISAIAPTCTTVGRTAEVVCSRCGETLETSRTLAALGHDRKTTIQAVEPSCMTAGRTAEVKCSRCGLVFESSITLPAFGEHTGAITRPAVDPTSSKPGMTAEIKCSRCGEVLQGATEIPALGYVRNVTARQLWPHKKVEVCYELADDIDEVADRNSRIDLSCSNGANVRTIVGDTMATPGKHRIVWDFEADGMSISNAKISFTVKVRRIGEVKNWDVSFEEGDVLAYEQGFLTRTFSSPSLTFDTTSDIWDGGASHSTSASAIQASSLAEHTTVAYGTYMLMKKDVKYNFKGKYDDFVMVKVGDVQLLKNDSECAEVSGSYTPSASGWYRVEFRVGNNGGAGGVTSSSYCGIKWNSSSDSTWRNIENTPSLVMFVLPTQVMVGATATSEAILVNWNSGMSVSSNGGWAEDPENAYEGRPALKSKSIGNSSSTSYVLQLQYCNQLEFAWKVSSEANYDYLNLYVDGVLKDRIAGETDWRSSCIAFGDLAVHEVRWSYEKDKYTVGGSDCGWVSVGRCDYYGDNAISGFAALGYSPIDAREVQLQIDGTTVLASEESGEYIWMPRKLGEHTLKHIAGSRTWTRKVNVTDLAFATDPSPKPPTAADANISITPTTRSVSIGGGASAITTSGSGTWTASASDSWITLNATSGAAGTPVGYRVAANDGIGQRVGYVYVSGHVHTVTQEGHEAEVTPTKIAVEHQGGEGTVEVAPGGHYTWTARPNADWLTVLPTSGIDAGTVTYRVAPYNEVATRTATLTVADKTVTVTQTGRRMKLAAYADSCDYYGHVIPIMVDALSSTTWSAEAHAPWLSIVDSDNGQNRKGGGQLSVATAENPSYLPRTGTVTVGTETFTLTQSGRPTAALSFSVSPTASAASVDGANGLISVTATPDLPWSAASGANWLTVAAERSAGAGNGNVVYSVSPNPTMSARTGTITVTPEAKSGLAAKTHTVTQPAATSMVSEDNHDFDARGDSFEVDVAVGDIVNWSVSCNADWVTIDGGTSRVGPGKVKIATAANPTVEPREATITIAGHTFKIFQAGRVVEVEVDSGKMVFGIESKSLSFDVHPDGNARWTAYVSDPTWILLWGEVDADGNVTGTGDAVLDCIVTDYVGDGTPRTGSITIGDQVIYITQRAYELSIDPSSAEVSPNAGAGEIGVPASVGDIWNAIATEPWITIISGYDSGTGSGTVRYSITENDTGRTRTGKILISGEEYTITQAARRMVKVQVEVEGGGNVSGNGTYELGTSVTLTATAKSGHEFTGWRMANGSVDKTNPLKLTADVDKTIVATFRQIPIYIVNGETVQEGESRTFTAPAPQIDAKGTTKLICKGTSAFPKMGTSFTLKITQDVTVVWDIWETNYLLTVESPEHGSIKVKVEGEGEGSATRWVKAGETVTLTAAPDHGYAFFRWTRDVLSAPVAGDGDGTVSMDGPKTVGAIFGVFNDTLAGALDAPGMVFVTGGDANWTPVVDATAGTGISSVRSGTIGAEKETWLETTVEGPGELSFSWRVDCERSVRNDASWDRLSVFTNGVEAARIDGRTDWRLVTLPIGGKTTVRWSFYRDDFDEAPPGTQNCGWVDGVIWTGKEGR